MLAAAAIAAATGFPPMAAAAAAAAATGSSVTPACIMPIGPPVPGAPSPMGVKAPPPTPPGGLCSDVGDMRAPGGIMPAAAAAAAARAALAAAAPAPRPGPP